MNATVAQVPHKIQNNLSGKNNPVLAFAVPFFKLFRTKWEKLGTMTPQLDPFIQQGLHFSYIHYAKMDHTKAYIISMCEYFLGLLFEYLNKVLLVMNPQIKLQWIGKNWEPHWISNAELKIKAMVQLSVISYPVLNH